MDPERSLAVTPAPTPPTPRARRPWRARLGLTLVGIVALAASAVLHLATDPGRLAVRDMIVAAMNSRIRGTASIAAVRRFDLGGVELEGFEVVSPRGTTVIQAGHMEAELGLLEIFRSGHILLTPCTLSDGTMRITRGPRDQIDLIYALEVPEDRWMPIVDVHDIVLRNLTMVFDLPGAPRVEMADVSGLVDMSLGHTFSCRLDRVRGYVNIPVLHVGFAHLFGRLRGHVRMPLRVAMILDLEIAHPSMRISYVAPRVVGGEGDPALSIELGVDVPDDDDDCGGEDSPC